MFQKLARLVLVTGPLALATLSVAGCASGTPDASAPGTGGDGSVGDGATGDGSQTDGTPDGSASDGAADGRPGDGSQGDGSQGDGSQGDGSQGDGSQGDGSATDGDDAGSPGEDAGVPPPPCTTRIQYGSSWFHPNGHDADFDVVQGDVRWDGQCVNDGNNSYATLSNGWQPRFAGHSACIMAIDHENCPNTAATCTTRIGYGAAWNAAAGNTTRTDVVGGKVTWNGGCANSGGESHATLSNGWSPYFTGNDACSMGFAYEECGGLYTNQLFHGGCADPGVLKDEDRYFVYCTGDGFNIWETPDLVHYTQRGQIFPQGARPSWIKNSYWAPEVHKIGDKYVAYFTGRDQTDRLSIGMATADSPTGPFTDHGGPFLRDPNMGLIDANAFADANGTWYLIWKADGNAVGQQTPIYGQALSADGQSLTGSRQTLITNDLGWEGGVVEGPWVIRHGTYFYMFYSGNAYYNQTYAVGAARATSPLGPWTKKGDPILKTNERWIGPGHCSVVDGPGGEATMVYHAWLVNEVGNGYGRQLLVDRVQWNNDWPVMPQAPSIRSVPVP